VPWGWALLRLPPVAIRIYVGSPAGASEVVAVSEVVATNVSISVVVSSAAAVVVVMSSATAVVVVMSPGVAVVVTSTVAVVSKKAILEDTKMVLVASVVETDVIVAASVEAQRLSAVIP